MSKQLILYLVLTISLLSVSNKALASNSSQNQECSTEVLRVVGSYLKINNFSFPERRKYDTEGKRGIINAGACKVWPYKNNITIGAFIYDADPNSNYDDENKALSIALINNQTKKVIAIKLGDYVSWGPTTHGAKVSIDTARYDLAPGVRAFGIDVYDGYSPSCGDGGSGPRRSLYIQNGNRLSPIIEDITMSRWQYVEGGSPGCVSPDAPDITVIKNISLSISISKESNNGFANLVIDENTSFDDGRKNTEKPNRYELVYNGKKYNKKK